MHVCAVPSIKLYELHAHQRRWICISGSVLAAVKKDHRHADREFVRTEKDGGHNVKQGLEGDIVRKEAEKNVPSKDIQKKKARTDASSTIKKKNPSSCLIPPSAVNQILRAALHRYHTLLSQAELQKLDSHIVASTDRWEQKRVSFKVRAAFSSSNGGSGQTPKGEDVQSRLNPWRRGRCDAMHCGPKKEHPSKPLASHRSPSVTSCRFLD